MSGPPIIIAGMVLPPSERFDTLYIGQWLTKLGRKAGEVAKKSGVDESYMSQLISGEKNNPSAAIAMAIAVELGISVNALYTKPPEIDVTGRARQLRPDQLEVLSSLLDEFKGPKGPWTHKTRRIAPALVPCPARAYP